MNEEIITYFGQTDARNKKVTFGIKAKDRTKHVYVIGKTGMGKSTLLENMAIQDIKNGEGLAFIDPHGKTAELLLEYVPEHRKKDVIYFAPFDLDFPISFNVLESVEPDKRHLVVSGLMSTFKKIWQDAWSARMEYILTNTLLALLEYPDATLLGVNRMLSDKIFRKKVITYITDPSVKAFWTQEFANYTERMALEAVPAIQNKIGQFTANALIRNLIGQPKSSFNIREMMDSRKIFIINLSKGRIGEANANLLGGMLITKIYLAALSRADVNDRVLKALPNFYLFVDEFQSFANESFADILSEARKYKLNLTIAHQYIEQMDEKVRAAVFGNVGTMIVFRVGAYDAEILEKEFAPQFTAEDLVNLGIYQIYLKLMIDGVSSSPFSATTIPPIEKPDNFNKEEVIEISRKTYANKREEVEKAIDEWLAPMKQVQDSNQNNSNKDNTKQNSNTNNSNQNSNSNSNNSNQFSNQSQNHNQKNNSQNPSNQNNQNQNILNKDTSNQNNIRKEIEKTPVVLSTDLPFKKAFEAKPINLNELNKKENIVSKNIQNPKVASKQNMDELRNVLASVMSSQKTITKAEGKSEIKQEVKTEQKVEEGKDKNTNSENKASEDKAKVKPEISEEKLREVLRVNNE